MSQLLITFLVNTEPTPLRLAKYFKIFFLDPNSKRRMRHALFHPVPALLIIEHLLLLLFFLGVFFLIDFFSIINEESLRL